MKSAVIPLWSLLLMCTAVKVASAQQPVTPDSPNGVPTATATDKADAKYELGGQATVIWQNMFKFRSLYQGTNSLPSRNEGEVSDTYTLYLGARLAKPLELYLDPEMARGKGIGEALGLAGYTNGDVIRNPTIGQTPYLARYFFRWNIPTGHGDEQVDSAENQIAGSQPSHRLVITAGKLGTNDIFDLNSYSNSTRTQFMNWALINNGAYDYAADTRGYTQGVALEWVNPAWAVRFGSFQMPTVANGPKLAGDLRNNRGEQLELELHPRILKSKGPAVVRLLGYRNVANMGNYRTALAQAAGTGQPPDITKVRMRGSVKYGFGLNWEQPLGDAGSSGLFGRLGCDDGATESFAYTEIDRTVCIGGQLSGRHWDRPNDKLAATFVQNDLATAHKDYLATGGLGFLLGDGNLSYAPERILETYYSWQVSRPLSIALDYQFVANPGYNSDRGPVSVLSLRAHAEF